MEATDISWEAVAQLFAGERFTPSVANARSESEVVTLRALVLRLEALKAMQSQESKHLAAARNAVCGNI